MIARRAAGFFGKSEEYCRNIVETRPSLVLPETFSQSDEETSKPLNSELVGKREHAN